MIELTTSRLLLVGLTIGVILSAPPSMADRVEFAASEVKTTTPTAPCQEVKFEPEFVHKYMGKLKGEKLRQAAHLRCWRCCEKERMKYSYMAESEAILECHCTNEF